MKDLTKTIIALLFMALFSGIVYADTPRTAVPRRNVLFDGQVGEEGFYLGNIHFLGMGFAVELT